MDRWRLSSGLIHAVDLSPNEQFLAAGTYNDETFIISSPRSREGRGMRLRLPDKSGERRNVLFSPRGDFLAITGGGELVVRRVGGEWERLKVPQMPAIFCSTWISSGKLLGGGTQMWKEDKGVCLDVGQGELVKSRLTEHEWMAKVMSMDVSWDHSMLACGTQENGSGCPGVAVVDLRDETVIHTFVHIH